ncbi:MAG: carbon monoxide dehydrogenase subunit G [Actinomycetota bacterium]|nr:carbon monoxide dehydrogenase subunit G [Actinomycetota bacterium]
MKVSGDAVLHAPVEKVWIALTDPAVLVRTIPGCERLEATGPDTYRMVVTAGVASIKGIYSGQVALTDQQKPHSFLLTASGAGAPGTVSTEVRVSLAEFGDGVTRLNYDADAVIGGAVAGVGQRMLAGVAKKMAGQFFESVDDVLTGKAVLGAAVSGEPGAAAVGEPGVFVSAPSDRMSGGSQFLRGALVGAAIALAGVAVGALVGGLVSGPLDHRRY